ncbi:hypothetical protein [Rhizobium sullae]|uniref:hypothetical protein n=1 Tax=Rhizobium sullae TaxID=50338 RepID=UPI001ADFED7A|nr:hypothetical protein [Rhizobium sullae]
MPSLNDTNLVHGEETADFFRNEHAFNGRRFSLIISNPPWAEPEGATRTSADDWAERAGLLSFAAKSPAPMRFAPSIS